ncbi:MAG: hypothetical protein CMLOHMNK_02229 [Steroidobacteraceae bacterium]|nr:hypothetical protein [Steroidobacteraceae bacterium]
MSNDGPHAAERRRNGTDRRQRTLHGLFAGSQRSSRRQGPRRRDDRALAAVDRHHPQWLAVALVILLLSCADAFLTLTLVQHGATEMNPVMAPLVRGSGRAFAFWKLLCTACGVIVLTILVRIRAFGVFPAGALLYVAAAGYAALVGYELWLLDRLGSIG